MSSPRGVWSRLCACFRPSDHSACFHSSVLYSPRSSLLPVPPLVSLAWLRGAQSPKLSLKLKFSTFLEHWLGVRHVISYLCALTHLLRHPVTEVLARRSLFEVRNLRPSLGGTQPDGSGAGPEGRQHLASGAFPPFHLLLHLPEQAHPAQASPIRPPLSVLEQCVSGFLFGSTVVHIRIREKLIHGPTLWKSIKIDNTLSCLRASLVAQMVKRLSAVRETWV